MDESGITPDSASSSRHFVLSAVVWDDVDDGKALESLAHLRRGTKRQLSQELHFNKVQLHGGRRFMTEYVGQRSWLTVVCVVVCKDLLPQTIKETDAQYNYTFRFLLERLSWLARERKEKLSYTAAHLLGYTMGALEEYEARLRRLGKSDRHGKPIEVAWEWLDAPGGRMVYSDSEERLQLADIVASGAACAFEPDGWGYREATYFRALSPRLYRYQGRTLLSYGLVLHPKSAKDHDGYQWVRDIR